MSRSGDQVVILCLSVYSQKRIRVFGGKALWTRHGRENNLQGEVAASAIHNCACEC